MFIIKGIERRAYRYILEQGINTLPLTFGQICKLLKKAGYTVKFYSEAEGFIKYYGLEEFKSYDAFTVSLVDENLHYVFIDDNLSASERAFIAGHELGHIELEHPGSRVLGHSGNEREDEQQEREATSFAYTLTAPPCVLKAMRVQSVKDVEKETMLEAVRADHAFVSVYEHGNEFDDIERKVISQYGYEVDSPEKKPSLEEDKTEDKQKDDDSFFSSKIVQICLVIFFVALAGVGIALICLGALGTL